MILSIIAVVLLPTVSALLSSRNVQLHRWYKLSMSSEDIHPPQELPFKRPRPQNSPGNLFVEESCIDCGVCRWMCPSVYSKIGIKAAVHTQPRNDDEKLIAFAAMVACPTGSIRTHTPDPLVTYALDVFPAEIDAERLPGVYHAGYHSEASFGATAYFVVRSGGNLMIDSPRFNARLADTIDSEGGLKYMILTHRDNIADHAKWKERFPVLERIIHRLDVTAATADCEVKLDGFDTWRPAPDLTIIHTPGRTAGSVCILYQPSQKREDAEPSVPVESVLFTGDHLANPGTSKALTGFPQYNHNNVQLQADSIRLLADEQYHFSWILPGHGRMFRFSSQAEKKAAIMKAADVLESSDDVAGLPGALGYD